MYKRQGEYNDIVIRTAKNNGYYPIQWNLDTLDYKGLTGDEMWKRIRNKISNGSIILSHNGTKNTANSLDGLIKNIKSVVFAFVRIGFQDFRHYKCLKHISCNS